MKKVFSRVTGHFKWLFWIVLFLNAIPVTVMLGHKKYLELPSSPNGIISMELAGTDSAARVIAKGWSTDTINAKLNSRCNCKANVYVYRQPGEVNSQLVHRLAVARSDIYWDFAFIFLYVLLAWLIIVKLESFKLRERWLILFLTLAVLAGLCDYIEDFGMLGYLQDSRTNGGMFPEPYYTWASVLKFVLLAGLLFLYVPVRLFQQGYLFRLSDYVTAKLHQLWRYRVIVASLLLFSLPIWFSDQGQDLLINISGSIAAVLIFLTIITLAAFLNWWLAKLFFQNEYHSPVMPFIDPSFLVSIPGTATEKKASRFLGVFTFLSPAAAMLQALNNYKIHYAFNFFLPVVWLAISVGGIYILLKSDYIDRLYTRINPQNRNRSKTFLLITLLMVVCIITIPVLFWHRPGHNTDLGRSPLSLTFISLDLFLMGFIFLVFVTLRESIIPSEWPWLREKIGIPIYAVASVVCCLFLFYNIFPLGMSGKVPGNFFCLLVLFSGFTFYTLFFTFLLRVGKWKNINIAGMFLLVCLLINLSVSSKYHNVRFLNRTNDSLYSSQIPLDLYFARWVAHRAKEIDASDTADTYPVFLVNTYGGGIRAAAFTGLVINHLNRSVREWNAEGKAFEHFVFSYSGASGGTIGASLLCANRYGRLQMSGSDSLQALHLTKFYNDDFLTSLIAGAIGRDIWAGCTGLSFWSDRSAIQEELWESRVHAQWDNTDFGKNYYSYWDTTAATTAFEIPLLFSNSCNVDDGLKGIMSPVLLNHKDFPATDFIADQVPSGKIIKLSTAAFLSARFPLLSPSGKTNDGFHFVDGGLKENSGAETSENIYLALSRFLRRYEPYQTNLSRTAALYQKNKILSDFRRQ